MKILKYKKTSNNRYEVTFDDERVLILYEETILKFNLLIKKEIDDDTMILLDKYNQECDVYYVALNRLKNRLQSIYDLKLFFKNREYPDELVDKVIKKLVKQGYLNDRIFARSYIYNQMIATSKGPYRLEKELLEKKVDLDIIKDELENFSEDEQIQKINKVIQKGINANHTRGGEVLKKKIFQDLKILGHDISLIRRTIDLYSFENNHDIAKREYEKLYRKYSRKYHGQELQNKIKDKLFQRGLEYDVID